MKHKGFLFCIAILQTSLSYAEQPQTPCTGDNNLLSIVNRPTVGDSSCVVPENSALLEMGYQYQNVTDGGYQQNAPDAMLRIGLPQNFEFNVTIPNYIHQTIVPKVGFTATTLGVKHVVAASTKWIATLEGLITLPSGSATFGSRNYGEACNGIASYNISEHISITGMFGVTSQSEPIYNGGGRYTSFNPDLVLGWSKDKIVIYWEVYGQSKTAPDEGNGFNTDVGLLYLAQQNVALDVEFAQRLNGSLYGFSRYIGAGITLQFN